jgi:hypothetical protein
MTENWWTDDDRLALALSEAVQAADDVPREFIAAGKAAFTWHTIDAELAALTYDSAIDHGQALVDLRSEPAQLRLLTFASLSVTIELEIADDSVLGQVVPPQRGDIEARDATTVLAAAVADEAGCFVLRPRPPGPFRLLVQFEGQTSVLTGWITV